MSALFQEIKRLTLSNSLTYANDTGIHTYFNVKLDGDLSMCEEPLHCLLTLFLSTKRPDIVADTICGNGYLIILFAILSRVVHDKGLDESVSSTEFRGLVCDRDLIELSSVYYRCHNRLCKKMTRAPV